MPAVVINSSTHGIISGNMTGAATIAAVGDAVADLGALTAAAPAALTSADSVELVAPTTAEYNALRADVVAVRTQVVATVADLATLRTKINALLDSLQAAGVIAP